MTTTPTTDEQSLTLLEVMVLAATVGVGLLGWAALFLAQHDSFTRSHIALLGLVAVIIIGYGIFRLRGVVRVVPRELIAGAAVIGLAAVMFFPGFPYAIGDKDPGVYVQHGFSIAEQGSTIIHDPIQAHADALQPGGAGAGRFPGIYVHGKNLDTLEPSFFHMWASLLATVDLAGGTRGVFNLTPLLAVLSVLAVALGARRVAGDLVGLITAVLLSVNMMQVWQAKYPTTEILSQLLLAGALLAIVVAMRTSRPEAAAAGGLLTGLTLLARPDGLLFVLLGAVGAGLFFIVGRNRRLVLVYAAGLAVTLPHALINAYSTSKNYTLANGIPGAGVFIGLLGLVVVATAVGTWLWPAIEGRARGWADSRDPESLESWRVRLAIAGVVLFAAMLLVFWFRESLLGQTHNNYNGRYIRTYNERNLRWLSNFFTVPGLLAVTWGVAVVLIRKWKAPLFVLLAPGILTLPVYLLRARISARMMWWNRRYVPGIVPALIILIAIAIAWALTDRRRWLKVCGAVAGLFLVAVFAHQSLPLRHHREMAGSYDVSRRIAAEAGGKPAVFLWQRPNGDLNAVSRNFAGSLLLIQQQPSALLAEADPQGAVERYHATFPDSQIFLVTKAGDFVDGLDQSEFTKVGGQHTQLPFWTESIKGRPATSTAINVAYDVWRYDPD